MMDGAMCGDELCRSVASLFVTSHILLSLFLVAAHLDQLPQPNDRQER